MEIGRQPRNTVAPLGVIRSQIVKQTLDKIRQGVVSPERVPARVNWVDNSSAAAIAELLGAAEIVLGIKEYLLARVAREAVHSVGLRVGRAEAGPDLAANGVRRAWAGVAVAAEAVVVVGGGGNQP
jgi:hypothetical protein